jgi:ethanolamine permease
MGIATVIIIILYACFTFSYAELACYIPKAGGVFDYATKAFGKDIGFLAGMAQIIEFVFAPPAIAFAIGTYFHLFFPQISALAISISAYIIFTLLNVSGVKAAAIFELVITIIAVVELLIFAGVTMPHFKMENLQHNALPNGWKGILGALPFAVWFFLGIEGLANVAEETKNPQKDILKGFGSAIFTLVVLCILTFVAAVGVGGWELIVFDNAQNGNVSDSPLPLAMRKVVGDNALLYHLLITIGLFGLVASFHGLILAAGRSTFEFGKAGLAPKFLGHIQPIVKTPDYALIANMCIGIMLLITNKTGDIIIISVLGALTLYMLAMLSLIALRRKDPNTHRPYRVPGYPFVPALAMVLAMVTFVLIGIYWIKLMLIYLGILLICFIVYKIFYKK